MISLWFAYRYYIRSKPTSCLQADEMSGKEVKTYIA